MKRALVTGGNRGIGYEVCRQLAKQGIQVFLASRDIDSGKRAAGSLQEESLDVIPVELDVSESRSINQLADRLEGNLDILINNAGVLCKDSILEGNLEAFDLSWRVHVRGPLELIQKFMSGMNERGYGWIVNVSSIWGSFAAGLEGPAPYSITKAALNALTVNVAKELKGDVKINSVCPGWVRTDMGGPSAEKSTLEGADSIVFLANLDANGPSGRFFRERKEIKF